jgi:hypothetical protein
MLADEQGLFERTQGMADTLKAGIIGAGWPGGNKEEEDGA